MADMSTGNVDVTRAVYLCQGPSIRERKRKQRPSRYPLERSK